MRELTAIETTINYSEHGETRPAKYFYQPDPPVEYRAPGTDPQKVLVRDAWPIADSLSLDREGFKITQISGHFVDFENPTAIQIVYIPKMAALLKRESGAQRIEIFDYTIRRSSTTVANQGATNRPPSTLAHVDYTFDSAVKRIRDFFPDEADALLGRRVALFNVWKPLLRPVENYPLALCDATSHSPDDFIAMDLVYSDRRGEIYVMCRSESHRWLYFPNMKPTDAIILKTFDSRDDSRARFVGHAAIEDPTSRVDAKPRESIEVRAMAFY